MFSTSIATAANAGARTIGFWTTWAGPRAVNARLPLPKIVSHFRMLAQSRQLFTTPLQSEQDPTISDPQRSGDGNGVDLPVFGTEHRDRFVGPFGQWLAFSALLLRGNQDRFIPA